MDQPACLLLCLLCTLMVTQWASLIQAKQSVRVAAEQALQASQNQVQALTAKMQRSENQRKLLQATMECITQPVPVQFWDSIPAISMHCRQSKACRWRQSRRCRLLRTTCRH